MAKPSAQSSAAAPTEPTAPTGCGSDAPPPSRTDRLVARLERLPRVGTGLGVVALVVIGLVIAGPAGAAIAGLGIACLAGILALTWHRITVSERALRLAVLVFVIGLTIVRTVPR